MIVAMIQNRPVLLFGIIYVMYCTQQLSLFQLQHRTWEQTKTFGHTKWGGWKITSGGGNDNILPPFLTSSCMIVTSRKLMYIQVSPAVAFIKWILDMITYLS